MLGSMHVGGSTGGLALKAESLDPRTWMQQQGFPPMEPPGWVIFWLPVCPYFPSQSPSVVLSNILSKSKPPRWVKVFFPPLCLSPILPFNHHPSPPNQHHSSYWTLFGATFVKTFTQHLGYCSEDHNLIWMYEIYACGEDLQLLCKAA